MHKTFLSPFASSFLLSPSILWLYLENWNHESMHTFSICICINMHICVFECSCSLCIWVVLRQNWKWLTENSIAINHYICTKILKIGHQNILIDQLRSIQTIAFDKVNAYDFHYWILITILKIISKMVIYIFCFRMTRHRYFDIRVSDTRLRIPIIGEFDYPPQFRVIVKNGRNALLIIFAVVSEFFIWTLLKS